MFNLVVVALVFFLNFIFYCSFQVSSMTEASGVKDVSTVGKLIFFKFSFTFYFKYGWYTNLICTLSSCRINILFCFVTIMRRCLDSTVWLIPFTFELLFYRRWDLFGSTTSSCEFILCFFILYFYVLFEWLTPCWFCLFGWHLLFVNFTVSLHLIFVDTILYGWDLLFEFHSFFFLLHCSIPLCFGSFVA